MKTSEMKDRELLELAAKAAGLNVCAEACHDDDGLFIGTGVGDLWKWQPLTEDDQAFRLAGQLGISIFMPAGGNFVRAAANATIELEHGVFADEMIGSDKMAAARRAIVRAAAEIGKAMP